MSNMTDLGKDLLKFPCEDHSGFYWYRWPDVIKFTEQQLTTKDEEIARLKSALGAAVECLQSYRNCNPSPVYAEVTLELISSKLND